MSALWLSAPYPRNLNFKSPSFFALLGFNLAPGTETLRHWARHPITRCLVSQLRWHRKTAAPPSSHASKAFIEARNGSFLVAVPVNEGVAVVRWRAVHIVPSRVAQDPAKSTRSAREKV